MIDRIEELKKYFGLSTRALALRCGMNQPTLDRMLKGVNALNLNCITSIAEAFPEISAEWLLRGEGEMLKSASAIKPSESTRINSLLDTIALLNENIISLKNENSSLREKGNQPEMRLNK